MLAVEITVALVAGLNRRVRRDDTKVTVEVAADGLSAKLRPVAGQVSTPDVDGNPTPLVFTFEGDADLGAGVRPIAGTYECILAEDEATGLVVEEGADEL